MFCLSLILWKILRGLFYTARGSSRSVALAKKTAKDWLVKCTLIGASEQIADLLNKCQIVGREDCHIKENKYASSKIVW